MSIERLSRASTGALGAVALGFVAGLLSADPLLGVAVAMFTAIPFAYLTTTSSRGGRSTRALPATERERPGKNDEPDDECRPHGT